MLIDGEFHCYTMEDIDRFLENGGVKIPKQTAIPRGTYRLGATMSKRFGCVMPQIFDVPQFDGIRIHKGQRAEDTEGCPLVGMKRVDPFTIANCAAAYDPFFKKLMEALGRNEPCYCIVS
jgi:hypothetical protein